VGHDGKFERTDKIKPDKVKAKIIRAAVKKYKELLGLPNWPVYMYWAYDLKDTDEGPELAAFIDVLATDNEVHLFVNTRIVPEHIDRVVAHEMVHWLMEELRVFSTESGANAKYFKYLLEKVVEAVAISISQPSRKDPAILLEPK
jgi:hypothetical protein